MLRRRNRSLVAVAVVLAATTALTSCSGRREATPSTGTVVDSVPSAPTSPTGAGAGPGTTVVAAPRPAVAPKGQVVDGGIATPDGRERTYHVYVPSTLPDGPVPLLVAMHGGVGNGRQFEENSGFDGVAEANGFLVVYPDGVEIGGPGILSQGQVWNGGACCGRAAREEVDDVTFLSMLIDEIGRQRDVDPKRVYATGHSNGGIMSYRLACELADKVVAIALQSGTLELASCTPSQPVSLLHIHGADDRNLPLAGGKGAGLSNADFRPPADGVHTIARADGCPATSSTATLPENHAVHVETWAPCADGTEVQFVTIDGASHAWMGHETTRAGQGLPGAPYPDFDSTAAIWAFLAAHPRP